MIVTDAGAPLLTDAGAPLEEVSLVAYSVAKNSIFFERMKNLCVAARGLAQEAQALKDVHAQEAKPGGIPHADYDDTEIATTAEFDTAVSFLTEYLTFYNGGGTLANTARGLAWTLPFTDTTPA